MMRRVRWPELRMAQRYMGGWRGGDYNGVRLLRSTPRARLHPPREAQPTHSLRRTFPTTHVRPGPRYALVSSPTLRTFGGCAISLAEEDTEDAEIDGEAGKPELGDRSPPPQSQPPSPPSHLMKHAFQVPESVTLLPIHHSSILPGTIGRAAIYDLSFFRDLQTLQRSHKDERPFVGLFLIDEAENDVSQAKSTYVSDTSQLHQVGVLGLLTSMTGTARSKRNEGDPVAVIQYIALRNRIRIKEQLPGAARLAAKIEELHELPYDRTDPELRATQAEIEEAVQKIAPATPVSLQQGMLLQNFKSFYDPHNVSEAVDLVAGLTLHMSVDENDRASHQQAVLQELDVKKRQKLVLNLVNRELHISQVSSKMKEDINSMIEDRHRKMMLQEQLKSIRQELGLEKPQAEELARQFAERMEDPDLQVPDAVKTTFDEELERFRTLPEQAPDFGMARNYLDWLTQLPWGKYSTDSVDLLEAEKVLNAEHYGMKDVKERILEFIAVEQLKGSTTGKILCLVGPPGVGKTSIGKSVAKAVNREFYRFSVGGMTDESEIKGHRRTYIGAMPGKFVQAIKQVQTANPVIMLDEIDKIGAMSFRGDPSSALLEALDPEQNVNFLDHYMDVPVDLSKVLFLCTANVLHTVPEPLRDRMEVITLSGYVGEEKKTIASRYLIPQALAESGLSETHVNITPRALDTLIDSYCREAGVRDLRRNIGKLLRKVAHKVVVEESAEQVQVDSPTDVEEYLGQPTFRDKRIYPKTPVGVVLGLAWTSMGGSIPYVEAVRDLSYRGKVGSVKCTGQLGDVMKESTSIAYTYAKKFWSERSEKQPRFFHDSRIHVHMPEGATPKDGPSAGIAMVTALLSLAENRPVKDDVAMTGEITLTGKVLPVGGIKEKTLAAGRSGIKQLVLPLQNKPDWEDLEDFIKEGLEVHFADYYSDVYEACFQ